MRSPLRLTADLVMARLAQRVRLDPGARLVHFVDAAEILHQDSNHPVSHELIREIVSSRSPVVWIGGSEPLLHPGISHLVRAIAQTGHFVFLETDGDLLRRRIHEFQPTPRLFLTVRLEADPQRQISKNLQASSRELAVEGIRAARLSGFLICVHARVHADTEMGEMAELIQFVHSLDVDGIVIAPANDERHSANQDAAALQQKTEEARKLIGSMWWESFSRMIEPLMGSERGAVQSNEEMDVRFKQKSHASEEGVKVA